MKQTEYYTPEVEEFHIGFECEFRDDPTKDDWELVEADADFIGTVQYGLDDQEPPYIYKERFRVKHIVKEDFLSLGFNRRIKDDISLGRVETFTKIIGGDYSFEKKTVLVKRVNNTFLFEIELQRRHNLKRNEFWIELKNKSELNRLLKQINVI